MHSLTLYCDERIRIQNVECGAGCPPESGPEASAWTSLVFVRSGAFIKHLGSKRVIADTSRQLIFRKDREFRVSHPFGLGDKCTEYIIDSSMLAEAAAACDTDDWEKVLSNDVSSLADPSSSYRNQVLTRRLEAGLAAPLEVRETAVFLVRALLRGARSSVAQRSVTVSRKSGHEQADAVKAIILHQPSRQWRLEALANMVNASPFHLARNFRQRFGMPIHQFQLLVRLQMALERILAGENDLTLLALDLGFSSHSHFTTAFGKRFGVPPSAARAMTKVTANIADVPIQ